MIHEVLDSDEYGGVIQGANDIVVVEQADGTFKSSPMIIQVDKYLYGNTKKEVHFFMNDEEAEIELAVNGSGKVLFDREDYKYYLKSEEWEAVGLDHGVNHGKMVIEDYELKFNVFLYDQDAKFIVTDIDGTITRSDIKGHLKTRFKMDHHHKGVIELFDKADENGYNIFYLTARSVAQYDTTKAYLFEVRFKNSNFQYYKINFSNFKIVTGTPYLSVQFSCHQELLLKLAMLNCLILHQ